ncbi:MAG: hypothetical protein O3B01_00655 [Planctomycetota bacterium]|nr:hypothetical protein [Planctomycetota bacterium]MDA1137064.1 hypothetical protein [Planctomycetota bacterium]
MSEVKSQANKSVNKAVKAIKKHPEVVVVVAVLLIVPLIFGPRSAGVLDPKPELPADEANRVKHSKGFSIIKPKGWESIEFVDDTEKGNAIVIRPRKVDEYSPSLEVTLCKDQTEIETLMTQRQYSFSQGRYKAVIFNPINGPFLEMVVGITREGQWYKMTLSLPNGLKKYRYRDVPQYWWAFLNSFKA